jgi:hypothetical protein
MCGSDADNYCDKCDVPYCDDCSCQCNATPSAPQAARPEQCYVKFCTQHLNDLTVDCQHRRMSAPSPEEAKPDSCSNCAHSRTWHDRNNERCFYKSCLCKRFDDTPAPARRDELTEAAREMLGSVADLEGTPIDYRVGKALAESCKRLRRALTAQGGK